MDRVLYTNIGARAQVLSALLSVTIEQHYDTVPFSIATQLEILWYSYSFFKRAVHLKIIRVPIKFYRQVR